MGYYQDYEIERAIRQVEAQQKEIEALKNRMNSLEEKTKKNQHESEKIPCDGCRRKIHPEDEEVITAEDGEKTFCSERCLDNYYWKKKGARIRC